MLADAQHQRYVQLQRSNQNWHECKDYRTEPIPLCGRIMSLANSAQRLLSASTIKPA